MKLKKWSGAFLLALALSATSMVRAQPDANAAPKAANPPNWMPLPAGADWQKMTPAQRREMIRKFTEQMLRGSMAWLGFNDPATQQAVIDCTVEQEEAVEPLRDQHRKVTRALLANALTERQAKDALARLRVAAKDAREARETAIATLEEKVAFSKNPRLEAFLSAIGLIGDESNLIGGVAGGITGALGNLAIDPEAAKPARAAPPAVPQEEGGG